MSTAVQTTATPVQLTLFDLEALEVKVRQGLAGFLEVGEALQQIRDGEGYCEKVFNFSVRQGQRLIVAARTTGAVKQITGEAPASESVAREFTPVANDPEVVIEAHHELRSQGKTIQTATAADVKAAVHRAAEAKGKPLPKPAPKPTTTAKPSSNGKPTRPEPKPEMPPAPTATTADVDFCPHCGDVPERYERSGDKWHCGACGSQVAISVAAA